MTCSSTYSKAEAQGSRGASTIGGAPWPPPGKWVCAPPLFVCRSLLFWVFSEHVKAHMPECIEAHLPKGASDLCAGHWFQRELTTRLEYVWSAICASFVGVCFLGVRSSCFCSEGGRLRFKARRSMAGVTNMFRLTSAFERITSRTIQGFQL